MEGARHSRTTKFRKLADEPSSEYSFAKHSVRPLRTCYGLAVHQIGTSLHVKKVDGGASATAEDLALSWSAHRASRCGNYFEVV